MRKRLLWIMVGLVGLAFCYTLLLPRLQHSASELASISAERRNSTRPAYDRQASPAAPDSHFALAGTVYAAEQMVIRSAQMTLLTRDVRSSADQVRSSTAKLGGFIEKATFAASSGSEASAEITVRVPSDRLDDAISAFRTAAVRVENESIESRDVSREWVDTEARIRNYRAEEEQYLSILTRAAKVKDTLEVAEKLSEVRGEVERLQADLNYLSHQVQMSSITLSIRQQPAAIAGRWRPGDNARAASHTLLSGLADFADFVVSLAIILPLVLLWAACLGGLVLAVWKLSLRWRKHAAAA
jgi:Domain of unknown function (DUF4349)